MPGVSGKIAHAPAWSGEWGSAAFEVDRIFNVLGDPVDELGPCPADLKLPIHKNAPAFVDLDTNLAIFETSIY